MIVVKFRIVQEHYYNYDEDSEYYSFSPVIIDDEMYSVKQTIVSILDDITQALHVKFKLSKIQFYPMPDNSKHLENQCLASFKTVDGEEFNIYVTSERGVEFDGECVFEPSILL